MKDLRRLGNLYCESQTALHALEKELAEARKKACELESNWRPPGTTRSATRAGTVCKLLR